MQSIFHLIQSVIVLISMKFLIFYEQKNSSCATCLWNNSIVVSDGKID